VDDEQSGLWESLVDRRIPPKPKRIPAVVKASAVTLRRACPDISIEEAMKNLIGQYGDAGNISRTSLFRIWKEAGLLDLPEEPVEEVVVEEFHGGAGLALIGAAEAEIGATQRLAEATLNEARLTVATQKEKGLSFPVEPSGRDERGHFTADYNQSTRADVENGKRDARWTPDSAKRNERDLSRLQILEHSPRIVQQKLMAIGVLSLVTERRGFDGMDGPCGKWLSACCGYDYMPSTLDKFLAQLGLLNVEDALWGAHAAISRELIVRWTSAEGTAPWRSVVIYIDSTQEPHWTSEYAKSGKISRTGRVGPCLTRIAITGGPGIPILVETIPGTVSLKTELPRILDRVEKCIGKGELGRFTIIDAEMATAKILHDLQSDPQRSFITVLKGRSVPKKFVASGDGEWQSFREHDQVRNGTVLLHGKDVPKDGVTIRAVEMRRPGRHPHSTFFGAAGKDTEGMSCQEVAAAYLTRWPNQESFFRDTRNGMGLERTHGYGGEMVQHVAIEKKAEKAERRLLRANEHLTLAIETNEIAEKLQDKAKKVDAEKAHDTAETLQDKTKKVDDAEKTHQLCQKTKSNVAAAQKAVESAEQEAEGNLLRAKEHLTLAIETNEIAEKLQDKAKKVDAANAHLCGQTKSNLAAAQKAVESAQKELNAINTTPRIIYKRDTTRENIVTAAKMTTILLIEYVLREYFAGLGIEFRTFIEYFVYLPVTIRTSSTEICYQIEENPRNNTRTQQLQKACAEITRRQIVRDGRRLVFEVVRPRRRRVELRPL